MLILVVAKAHLPKLQLNIEDFELLPIQLNNLAIISTLLFHDRDHLDLLFIAQVPV